MRTEPRGAGGAIPRPLLIVTRRLSRLLVAAFVVLTVTVPGPAIRADDGGRGDGETRGQVVRASWYGGEFANRRTASGERFDPRKLTAAHRTLPLGTRLRVTNLHNGRSTLVTVNDRGPYVGQRGLDLSYGAAQALDMVRRGVARVRIEPIDS